MAEAAKIAAGRGAALIDINMGCPAKKVVNGQAGSALMRDEKLAAQIMSAVVGAVSLPVTLKIRLGWDDETRNAPEIARVAEACGIKAITVHGRTRNQFFKGRAEWRPIGEVKQATSLPVIGNGDIATIEDAQTLLEQSGADGLMIGRAVRGRPWLPSAIMHALKFGRVPTPPPIALQGAVVHEHVDAMMSHYGAENGLRAARKHLGWFSEGLPGGEAFRARVVRLDDASAVFNEIDRYYGALAEQAAA
jgi:tRNA-dihydrouridine synthase B